MLRVTGRRGSAIAARSGAVFCAALAIVTIGTVLTGSLLTGTVLGGTALAGTMLASTALAGAVLTAALVLIASAARLAGAATALPQLRLARALREKAWRAVFLRVTDPDAPGRSRPRAPSAA